MAINRANTSKTLFKNTGIIAIGQISTKVVNFLLLPLYTTLLTTEQYGLIDLLITYSGLITVVIGMQVHQAIFRFLISIRNDKKEITRTISTILVFTGVVFVLYGVGFALVFSFVTVEYSWFIFLHVIASIYLQTLSGIARGLGDNTHYAIGNFLSSTVIILLNVIFIGFLRLGVGWMLLAYSIGPVLGGIYLTWKCKVVNYYSYKEKDISKLKEILKYAIPLIPNELSWTVIHSSDRWIVSAILTYSANGLIAVASKFSTIYTTVFSVFNTSWTEQIILHYKDDGGVEYVNEMFEKMVSFFACLAIGIISIMPFVFGLMVNKQFNSAYNLVPLYMIAVFFNAVIGLLSAVYLVNNETKQVAYSTMVAAIINLIVDIVLIKYVAVYAAPISSICGYMFISVWRIIDVNKRHCKIGLPVKKLILLLVNLSIALISFYCSNMLIQFIGLIIVIAISIMLNKSFLLDLIMMLPMRKK